MAPCAFDGNTDMYGLGIRIGFYLQWFSADFARILVPKSYWGNCEGEDIKHPLKDEIKGLRFGLNIFSAATFLALIIINVQENLNLQAVEIYIVLLLTFGSSIALVPIYIWRLIVRYHPRQDPTRWPIAHPSMVESLISFFLFSGVASYQLWFWFVRVPQSHESDCEKYGFFLARLRLDSMVMKVLNIILNIGILFFCLLMPILIFLRFFKGSLRKKDSIRPSISPLHGVTLQNLNILITLISTITVAIATELTIKWNNIQGVNSLASAGQTIPFIIGVASLCRILYVCKYKEAQEPCHDYHFEEPLDNMVVAMSATHHSSFDWYRW